LLGIREDRLLSESLGKTVSVFYNDTFSSVSLKTGIFLDFDDFSIKIRESEKMAPLLIPRQKCIRLEVEGGIKR